MGGLRCDDAETRSPVLNNVFCSEAARLPSVRLHRAPLSSHLFSSTSCCALSPSLHPSIHSSVHPSPPPAHHRHHYRGCTLGLIYSPVFPPASSSKRAAWGGEGGEGGEGGWRQRCRERAQDERGDGDVVGRGEMWRDSSVRRNDCSALGSDEWGPYRHIHRQSVSTSRLEMISYTLIHCWTCEGEEVHTYRRSAGIQ